MSEYKDSIENYFTEHPPCSISEAAAKIKELTGIERKETQVRKFPKSIGFRCLQVGIVPAKALTEKKNEQQEYLDKELQPRLEEAKGGKRIVYFSDAAHFVHGAFIACVWCIVRVFIPTPSGRSRYNVLGAIAPISHNFISLCNTKYINHLSIIELLEKIRESHNLSVIPISIFLDNAKYQVCKAVTEKAASLNIELMFLPSYSPNLNLIERLYKGCGEFDSTGLC